MTERETAASAAPPANARAGLFKKIMRVMAEVEYIPKNGRNEHFRYSYATEADVIDSLRKLMTKHGLAMLPMDVESFSESEVLTKSGKQRLITATLIFTLGDTETGETISSRVVAEGSDTGDKAFYKAYAGGLKYWLMKTFMVPTGDDPERDAPNQTKDNQQPDTAPAPRQNTNTRPPEQKPTQPRNNNGRSQPRRDTGGYNDREYWG